MLGSLKGGAREGARLGCLGATWVGIEEGLGRLGKRNDGTLHWFNNTREIGASVGTAGVLSAVCKFPHPMNITVSVSYNGNRQDAVEGRQTSPSFRFNFRKFPTGYGGNKRDAGRS